jgi:polyisoprenoid-binding protein YceI
MSDWKIDTVHSAILFSVRHLLVSKARGWFSSWTGEISLDPEDPAAGNVHVRIEAASVDTNEPKRDDHLRSADFFDAARYPELTFKSKKVRDLGGDRLRLIGDLTIRGVTKEVALEVEGLGRVKDPWGGERVGFSAKGRINREDFGLTWNTVLEAGGLAVGKDVEIEIELEAIRQLAVKAA